MRSRLLATLAALGSLVLGGLLTFGVVVWDDAVRQPHALGGGIASAFLPFVIPAALGGFFAGLGLALAPPRVHDGGKQVPFALGSALGGLAIVFALPTQLFCITLPLAVLCAIGATLALRIALRRAQS